MSEVVMKSGHHAKRRTKPHVERKDGVAVKMSKADFLRSWGILDPYMLRMGFNGLRYKHPLEKGVYWYHFSLDVRKRDVAQYGTCISCGKPITVEGSQAGHFIPARNCGRDLLFDPLNVNAECAYCNGIDELHLVGYAKGLDRRYGPGASDSLLARYYQYKIGPTVKDWKADVYIEKLKELGIERKI